MKLVGYNSQMETTIDSMRSAAVLLVGFFARARASVLAIVVASATAVGLAACGGGGGDNGVSGPTAYFHGAARVAGLEYRYIEGGSGETDVRGGFPIEQGKTVVFSIGNTEVGTMTVRSDAQNEIVTPLHIGDEGRAIKIERLLIAFNTDPMTALIDLREIEESDADDLFVDIQNLGDDEGELIWSRGRTITISSAHAATVALKKTNNCAYSGTYAGLLSDTSTSNSSTVAFVLMPNLTVDLTVDLTAETLTLTTASPAISFIRDKSSVEIAETILMIDLKTPPFVATFDLEGGETVMMTLISYDRIEFGDGTAFGTVRRVAGDPNADYRLVGVYNGNSVNSGDSDSDGGDGAFVADIYDGTNAQISYIDSPDSQDVLDVTRTGVFPTSETTVLTLRQVNAEPANSVALTLFADSNIFLGLGGNIGGTWCEL